MRSLYESGPNAFLETWALSGLLIEGVRAYVPTAAEFISLGQVENRVPWSSYRQPFPTTVTVIPQGVFPERISADINIPFFAIARHNREGRVLAIEILDGRTSIGGHLSTHCTWPAEGSEDMETTLASLPHDSNVDCRERDCLELVRRAVINANLLLTHHGARRLGTADPTRESALRDTIATGNRAARRAAERDLAAMPVIYGFEQHIRVYEEEGAPGQPGEGNYEVRPHWRRGHWANVACGPAHRERRLTFRPAVLVNAHRFGGDAFNTRVTMTTR